jgi:carbamoyltransferase
MRRSNLFEEVSFPNSLRLLYSTITAYLGFDVNDVEYKVMGLAPYGGPKYVEQMRRLLDMSDSGQYRLNIEYFDFLNGERMYSDRLPELFGEAPREPESDLGPFHKDVAASLQRALEGILLDKARYLHDARPVDNLCMAVAYTRLTGQRPELKAMPHVYLGPAYSNREISQTALAIFPDASIVDCTEQPDALIAETAKRLADGKVIGWF